MAGLSITEELKKQDLSGSRLGSIIENNLKDPNKLPNAELAARHKNMQPGALWGLTNESARNLDVRLRVAVQVTNPDCVEFMRKHVNGGNVTNATLFEFGSVELIAKCIDRFTFDDINSLLKNRNASDLMNYVLDSVSKAQDLATLMSVLNTDIIWTVATTDEQKLALQGLIDNAASLFQAVIAKRSAQIYGASEVVTKQEPSTDNKATDTASETPTTPASDSTPQ